MAKGKQTFDIELIHGVSSPARRALAAAGISRLEQLAEVSERQLSQLHGMGPKALNALKSAMAEHGLRFAPDGQGKAVSEKANRRLVRRKPATKS